MAELWFMLWLKTCRILGLHVVWTVHNVLPLEPLFANDVSARRALVEASDLVLAHSDLALTGLAELGIVPRRSAIIPHGPFAPYRPVESLRMPGSGVGPCQFLFIGRVSEYKGVDDLIHAFDNRQKSIPARLTIAGQCSDPGLRSRIIKLSESSDASVIIGPDRLSEARMTELIASADVVVLPFRRITTSGSVMLALAHGRPLIVPDAPSLAELPDTAVVRYDGSISGLSAAIVQVAMLSRPILAQMSESARKYAYELSWEDIARKTTQEMAAVLRTKPPRDHRIAKVV